ncbi:MAG: VOC family protein [Rhizobiales bacterium]|nr:VOC family protein [Hyphomicrobiales bacterium]OJY40806.1 MAG: bleomycin resistance family protein [Rhizobiales bacterium 64-17]
MADDPRQGAVRFTAAIPVLRIFSEDKAREFYLDFLGFTVDFEHRFGDNFPLYLQVSRGGLVLNLSEHHGDATPGARVRIITQGVAALHRELTAKNYRYAKPGLETTPWGSRDLTVADPFHNMLCFTELDARD